MSDLRIRRTGSAVVATLVVLFGWLSSTANAQMSVALRMEEPVVSWGESQLVEKLMYELNNYNGLEITRITGPLSDHTGEYDWESGTLSPDRIGRWGMDHRARFVVLFSHIRTDLKVEKGLSIPLALSRYNVVGRVSGKLKVVDTERNKVVVDREFSVDKRGPGAWQVLEDNPHSARLSIPATEKPAFLEALEWRAATELAELLRKKLKLR